MPLTNLNIPGGFVGPGIAIYPVLPAANAAVLYVNATGGVDGRSRLSNLGQSTSGPYGDPSKPLASVFGTNGALSFCSAGRGDLVLVAPGHTEAIAAAATIPAGVTVLGLGYGPSRPTFSLNTAITAVISLNAGARLQNCIVNGFGFAAITSVITLAGAGAQLDHCRIVQADATNKAVSAVTVSAADCRVSNCDIDSRAAAGGVQAVLAGAAVARFNLLNCKVAGNFSAANVVSSSTNHMTDLLIANNYFTQLNGTAKNVFNLTTSSTGLISDNRCYGTTWATAADVLSNSSSVLLRWFQNYGFDDGAGAVSGVLVPAVGTIA